MFRKLFCVLALLLPIAASAQLAQTVTVFPPSAKDITPHATNLLVDYNDDPVNMYVFVGVAGDVHCDPAGNPSGETIIFTIEAGQFVPVACKRVLVSGTTATGLVGIF
jgi:hypothetical protein